MLKTWVVCECFAEARRYQRRRTSNLDSLGRLVKRGEKGIFILAPTIGKKRKEEETAADADSKSDGEARLYGFRAVPVFDRLSRDLRPSLGALDGIRGRYFGKTPQ